MSGLNYPGQGLKPNMNSKQKKRPSVLMVSFLFYFLSVLE